MITRQRGREKKEQDIAQVWHLSWIHVLSSTTHIIRARARFTWSPEKYKRTGPASRYKEPMKRVESSVCAFRTTKRSVRNLDMRRVSVLLSKPEGVMNNTERPREFWEWRRAVLVVTPSSPCHFGNIALPPWSSWIHTVRNGFKSKNNTPPRSPCGASQPFYLEIKARKATSDDHMCMPPFTNTVPPTAAPAQRQRKTHHVVYMTKAGATEWAWLKWLNFGFLKVFWSWRLCWKYIYLKCLDTVWNCINAWCQSILWSHTHPDCV